MNYEKNIVQGIDTQMKEFFKNIEEKYKISKEELMDVWKGKIETTQKATPIPKDNKKSNYQKFFSIQRNIIMEQQPGLSFGEISKQVSVLWKQMSVEEKNKYTDIEPTSLEKIKVSQTPTRKPKSSASSKSTAPTQKNDDSSNTIQIIHRDAEATPRRSDLEIHQEDKDKENEDEDEEEDDEEDFFFEQDDQNESYDDNTIDDDDDSNDAELFDDQE